MSGRQRGLGRGLGALIAPAEAVRRQAAHPETTQSEATQSETTQSEVGQSEATQTETAMGTVGTEAPQPRALHQPATRTSPSDVFFNGGTIDLNGRPGDRPSPGGTSIAHPDAPDRSQEAVGVVDTASAEAAGGQVVGELRLVPVTSISPNPRQPRTEFDEEALDELTASIREVGVLQPVVVRPVGHDLYELVMGERRWRASQAVGLGEIPAVIRTTHDDDLLREALLENLHRSQLNPLEEAAAFSQLLTDFGCTHEELAGRLGTSRSHLTNTMRLLNLSPAVQRRVAAGVLSAGHARALLALPDAEAQDALATRIVAEGLSVRSVEELVAVSQPRRRRKAPAPRNEQPELGDIAAALTDRLDTRVKISMGRSKGRITVEFAGTDDLQRILAAMNAGPSIS